MVRGPRRGGAREGVAPTDDPRSVRKRERKLARATEFTHSAVENGWYKPSANDLVAAKHVGNALTEACRQLLVIRGSVDEDFEAISKDGLTHDGWFEFGVKSGKKEGEARGRIRGIAMSVALLRHPSRAFDKAWWAYVGKLEKKHMAIARSEHNSTE